MSHHQDLRARAHPPANLLRLNRLPVQQLDPPVTQPLPVLLEAREERSVPNLDQLSWLPLQQQFRSPSQRVQCSNRLGRRVRESGKLNRLEPVPDDSKAADRLAQRLLFPTRRRLRWTNLVSNSVTCQSLQAWLRPAPM